MRAPRLLAVTLAGLAVFGCAPDLGSGNPRPDDPAVVRPVPPEAAITWASIEWQPTTYERPAHTSEEQRGMPTAVGSVSAAISAKSQWGRGTSSDS